MKAFLLALACVAMGFYLQIQGEDAGLLIILGGVGAFIASAALP